MGDQISVKLNIGADLGGKGVDNLILLKSARASSEAQ